MDVVSFFVMIAVSVLIWVFRKRLAQARTDWQVRYMRRIWKKEIDSRFWFNYSLITTYIAAIAFLLFPIIGVILFGLQ